MCFKNIHNREKRLKKICVKGIDEYQFSGKLFSVFGLFYNFLFIYLFLAALGLHCCTWAFSSCSERGLHFIVVCGLLVAVAALVAEHGL